MKKLDYKNYTTEELKKKEKQSKVLAGLLVGMLIVLLIVLGYKSVTTGVDAFFLMPIAILLIAIGTYTNAKNIKKEILSRKEK